MDDNVPNNSHVNNTPDPPEELKASWSDLVAFWICGLLNNFGYSVMLSAALDLLSDAELSPAIVLLADIFPCLRVIVIVVLAVLSFLIPALTDSTTIKLIGVVFAALSSGAGEITFLSYSSYFHKDTVAAWSSGTGGAGILGSWSYLGLRYLFNPKNTLFVSSPLPLGMGLCFFLLMSHPKSKNLPSWNIFRNFRKREINEKYLIPKDSTDSPNPLSLYQRIRLMISLLPYAIPLAIVYFGEYLINQSVAGVLVYENSPSWISGKEYTYYQALYQVGVFISRSSVKWFPIKTLWLLQFPAIFQTINAVFLSFEAIYAFIPYIYITFVIIFWEGLLGGSIYVNTFYLMSQKFTGKEKEFCLGATSMSYAFSITICAIVGIFYYPFLQGQRAIHAH